MHAFGIVLLTKSDFKEGELALPQKVTAGVPRLEVLATQGNRGLSDAQELLLESALIGSKVQGMRRDRESRAKISLLKQRCLVNKKCPGLLGTHTVQSTLNLSVSKTSRKIIRSGQYAFPDGMAVQIAYHGGPLDGLSTYRNIPVDVKAVSLEELFAMTQIFVDGTCPRFLSDYNLVPEDLVDQARPLLEAYESKRREREVLAKVAKKLEEKAIGDVVSEVRTQIRSERPPSARYANRFEVLATEDADSAYLCGLAGVFVADEEMAKTMSLLSPIIGGDKTGVSPKKREEADRSSRDVNWRSCVRRLKKKVMNVKPTTAAYVLGRMGPEPMPEPVRRHMVRRFKKAARSSLSLKLLRDGKFAPLTGSENIIVLKSVKGVPGPIRTKVLRMVSAMRSTAQKCARTSNNRRS